MQPRSGNTTSVRKSLATPLCEEGWVGWTLHRYGWKFHYRVQKGAQLSMVRWNFGHICRSSLGFLFIMSFLCPAPIFSCFWLVWSNSLILIYPTRLEVTHFAPWSVWLSWLDIVLQTDRLPVLSPRGNRWMFLSLCFSLPSPFSRINKRKRKLHILFLTLLVVFTFFLHT